MKIIKHFKSEDGKTVKYLQKAHDGNIIETGYYNLDEHIVCISSQIGCSMGCIFCATTGPLDGARPSQRFIRNLTAEEIAQQVKNILRMISPTALKPKRILLSYMGMGEPFLNYHNVIQSINNLAKTFSNSRATIATLGIAPEKMKEIAHEKFPITLKLHLSLHAPNDSLRQKILPKVGKMKLSLEALKYFSAAKKVTSKVNYLLIKGLNDSERCAIRLAKLLEPYSFTVKLTKLNPYRHLESSDVDKFTLFEKILHSYGIETCRFISTGTDIEAGCGQFRRGFEKSRAS